MERGAEASRSAPRGGEVVQDEERVVAGEVGNQVHDDVRHEVALAGDGRQEGWEGGGGVQRHRGGKVRVCSKQTALCPLTVEYCMMTSCSWLFFMP